MRSLVPYSDEAPLCRASINLAQVDGWNQALRAAIATIEAREKEGYCGPWTRETIRQIELLREACSDIDLRRAQTAYEEERESC